jgi:hypothetical protein
MQLHSWLRRTWPQAIERRKVIDLTGLKLAVCTPERPHDLARVLNDRAELGHVRTRFLPCHGHFLVSPLHLRVLATGVLGQNALLSVTTDRSSIIASTSQAKAPILTVEYI